MHTDDLHMYVCIKNGILSLHIRSSVDKEMEEDEVNDLLDGYENFQVQCVGFSWGEMYFLHLLS